MATNTALDFLRRKQRVASNLESVDASPVAVLRSQSPDPEQLALAGEPGTDCFALCGILPSANVQR